MNIKLTNKDLRNNFSAIVSCGYCEMQSLLNMKNRVGYYTDRERIVKDFEKALITLVRERLVK